MAEHDRPGSPGDGGASASGRTVTVGLVADPGMADRIAERVAADLPDTLSAEVDDTVSWRVETDCEELTLNDQGNIPIRKIAHRMMAERRWDYLVALTDLPRHIETHPVLSSFSTAHRTALISLPAAGGLWPRRHVRQAVVYFLGEAAAALGAKEPSGVAREPRSPVTLASPIHRLPVAKKDMEHHDTYTALIGVRGKARMLFGMVRGNRPWRLIPSLSSALAAATATAAFGVFYGSIWAIADALSPLRLALISAFALTAMTVWLIAYNDLWERPSEQSAQKESVLYNTVTIVTVVFGVVCMYALLFTATLIGVLIVIDPQLLQSELGHPVGITDYGAIAWLASSMGTVAGALGSTFESEEAVRTAAYSKRELERRARFSESSDAQS
ncbi:MAG: hypothetical protein M0026_04405 [Nocardiopsaceae bacterium]|nr:hypothetical protein [Nocardiopsaceae bacterium]